MKVHAAQCLALGLTLGLSGLAFAQAVTVTLDPTHPGAAIPAELDGLSYEMVEVLPSGGSYEFRASNSALIGMFQSLGVRTLRLGGNTADTDAIPADADIDSLFAFAKAAGVQVIFTLKLKTFSPTAAAATATYVMSKYASDLICFANGNEPNAYYTTFSAYSADVAQYVAAVTAPGAAPGALFCGPGETANGTNWIPGFIAAFGAEEAQSTVHEYPGGDGPTVASASAACDTLLASTIEGTYQTEHGSFGPFDADAGLPSRIEETNTFYNGGAAGASNAYASALWALDYMYFWAGNGLAGLNFHTSDTPAANYYSVFSTATGGYAAAPMAYGIKAFALGGQGQILPVTLANSGNVNLTAYGVLGSDGDTYATVINRTHGTSPVSASVTLDPGAAYASASAWYLEAPSGNVLATSGVTLGGAAIGTDGSWSGTATPLTASNGGFTFTLPAATAAVVQLVPVVPDGGVKDDGGVEDAGHPEDAGTLDAGRSEDGGPSDAGRPEDAGAADAGRQGDAGQPEDAGRPGDGGLPEDAGASSGSTGESVGGGSTGGAGSGTGSGGTIGGATGGTSGGGSGDLGGPGKAGSAVGSCGCSGGGGDGGLLVLACLLCGFTRRRSRQTGSKAPGVPGISQ